MTAPASGIVHAGRGQFQAKKKPGRPKSSVSRAAEAFGRSYNSTLESLAIGRLSPKVRKAAEAAGIKKFKELLLIARTPEEDQLEVVRLIAACRGLKRSNTLSAAWSRASEMTRREFIEDHREALLDLLAAWG
jgi:hypothetical protein